MNDLIQLLFGHLRSDDGPEIYDDRGEPAGDEQLLEIAQDLAGVIVAAGWPREGAAA